MGFGWNDIYVFTLLLFTVVAGGLMAVSCRDQVSRVETCALEPLDPALVYSVCLCYDVVARLTFRCVVLTTQLTD